MLRVVVLEGGGVDPQRIGCIRKSLRFRIHVVRSPSPWDRHSRPMRGLRKRLYPAAVPFHNGLIAPPLARRRWPVKILLPYQINRAVGTDRAPVVIRVIIWAVLPSLQSRLEVRAKNPIFKVTNVCTNCSSKIPRVVLYAKRGSALNTTFSHQILLLLESLPRREPTRVIPCPGLGEDAGKG